MAGVLAQVDAQGQTLTMPQMAARMEDDVLEIFLYDDIGEDYYDWWEGKIIERVSAADFQKVLSEHPTAKEIKLFVNSRGGSVVEAMGIRAHLLRHKAHKVAYVDGWAASAASLVITACDEIKMLTGSMQMLHSMWVCICGNASELRKTADDLDQMMKGNREIYREKAGEKLSEEKLIEIMDEERWLPSSECLELGLADQILSAAEYAEEAPSQRGHIDPQALAGQQPDTTISASAATVQLSPEIEAAIETYLSSRPDQQKTPDQSQINEPDPQPEDNPEQVQKNTAQNLMAALLTAVERTQENE